MDVHYIIAPAFVLVPLFAAYLVTMTVLVLGNPGRFSPWRLVVLTLAACYALGVLRVTLLPVQIGLGRYGFQNDWYDDIMPVPLVTADLRSFSLNIAMMLPFGVLLPMLLPRVDTVRKVAVRSALVSLTIETTQLLSGLLINSRHSVDVNDLLANTIGAVLGFVCLRFALNWEALRRLAGRFAPAVRRARPHQEIRYAGHDGQWRTEFGPPRDPRGADRVETR